MKFTTSALTAFLFVASVSVANSFVPATKQQQQQQQQHHDLKSRTRTIGGASEALFLAPEDLTNYMAKAHEEKLRALKDVETKKNEVIKALKEEVDTMKQSGTATPKDSAVVLSSPPPSGMDLSSMTTEQLRAKLVQYQQFMANYIVQAQQQKMRAVQAAELSTAAKYEAKIKLLLTAASSDSSTASAAVASPAAAPPKAKEDSSVASTETKLHDKRNANVAAAAKAGKSRWGDKEVAKVKITTPTSPDADVKSKPMADKVNGTKQANGVAAATTTAPPPVSLPGSDVFTERNKKVAEAGKAGKSRWGDAEVKKATEEVSKQPSLSSATQPPPAPAATEAPVVVVSPEIEAADHGLRNDGGVGGPSLAERVNLGQQLFDGSDAAVAPAAAAAPLAPLAEVSSIRNSYNLRNAKIAAAAAAGKSRWGSMENSKATSLTSAINALPAGESAAPAKKPEIVSTPEIEAADHGLRNDGGVGGPSLAERVNLGSGLLKDLE